MPNVQQRVQTNGITWNQNSWYFESTANNFVHWIRFWICRVSVARILSQTFSVSSPRHSVGNDSASRVFIYVRRAIALVLLCSPKRWLLHVCCQNVYKLFAKRTALIRIHGCVAVILLLPFHSAYSIWLRIECHLFCSNKLIICTHTHMPANERDKCYVDDTIVNGITNDYMQIWNNNTITTTAAPTRERENDGLQRVTASIHIITIIIFKCKWAKRQTMTIAYGQIFWYNEPAFDRMRCTSDFTKCQAMSLRAAKGNWTIDICNGPLVQCCTIDA